MFNAEKLQEKWAPVLGHEGSSPIGDRYKKAVTSVLLENQERFMREERGMLNEVAVNSLALVLFLLLVAHSAILTLQVLQVSTLY